MKTPEHKVIEKILKDWNIDKEVLDKEVLSDIEEAMSEAYHAGLAARGSDEDKGLT